MSKQDGSAAAPIMAPGSDGCAESYVKNETMMWLSGTGNSVSCSSPSTLSVLRMMETNANSVNMNTPRAKYVQLVVNKRTLLMKMR